MRYVYLFHRHKSGEVAVIMINRLKFRRMFMGEYNLELIHLEEINSSIMYMAVSDIFGPFSWLLIE